MILILVDGDTPPGRVSITQPLPPDQCDLPGWVSVCIAKYLLDGAQKLSFHPEKRLEESDNREDAMFKTLRAGIGAGGTLSRQRTYQRKSTRSHTIMLWVAAMMASVPLAVASAEPVHGSSRLEIVAPWLSENLGSVYAGAARCGLWDEAQAVARKHRQHVDLLIARVPAADPTLLDEAFQSSSVALTRETGFFCSKSERQEIRAKLPDFLAAIDAYDEALPARR